ncbi:MAG: hypothetical protein NVSMB70_13090 [Chamaesiphon sp.]
MLDLSWHDYLVFISLFACIAGLLLLLNPNKAEAEDLATDERMLLLMSFTYWLVHCVAVGIQEFQLPDWDILLLSLKLTAVISYLLTFSCVLSLPLHHFASRYVE